MRALTSTDALFLATENRRAATNVSCLAILERRRSDGTELTIDHIRQLFAERLHLLAPLGWQLVEQAAPRGRGRGLGRRGDERPPGRRTGRS
jgi:hypothetical protein